MRKKDNTYLIQEAMSFCFKEKYKVYIMPNRGGSMKSPPKCKIIVSNKGSMLKGSKEYDQDSDELYKAISDLYLKYHKENG